MANEQILAALRAILAAGGPSKPVVSGPRPPSMSAGPRKPTLQPEGGEILGRAKTIVDLLNALPLGLLGDVGNPMENLDAAGPVGAVKKGIKAYHGSPHDFDQFSLSKIGTGEGAQAYGHGLYFADSEGVARNYRDALSAGGDLPLKADPSIKVPNDYAQSSPARRAEIKAEFQRMSQAQWADDAARERAAKQVRAFEAFDQSPETTTPGRMYEVNINADPEDFLDWDAPEQSPRVKEMLKNNPYFAEMGAPGAGRSIYRELQTVAAERSGIPDRIPAAASQELKRAGIPGIKYLDGASRSFTPPTIKDGPHGAEVYWGNDPRPVGTFPTRQEAETVAKQFDTRSRNYVVFDDALIEIRRKYGFMLPIMGAAGFEQWSRQKAAEQTGVNPMDALAERKW